MKSRNIINYYYYISFCACKDFWTLHFCCHVHNVVIAFNRRYLSCVLWNICNWNCSTVICLCIVVDACLLHFCHGNTKIFLYTSNVVIDAIKTNEIVTLFQSTKYCHKSDYYSTDLIIKVLWFASSSSVNLICFQFGFNPYSFLFIFFSLLFIIIFEVRSQLPFQIDFG